MTDKEKSNFNIYKEKIKQDLVKYRSYKNSLLNLKLAAFSIGSEVYVKGVRYCGNATVSSQDEVPVDKLAVMLENGNVWWYNIEDVDRI